MTDELHLNGVRHRIRREGEGPLVALIHGVGSSLESWDDVAAGLKSRFTVLRYDLRGHGQSEKPPGPYSIRLFSDDLAALLRASGIPRAHIVGFSLGGLIAQAFAIDHPQNVDKLVILSAVADKSAEEMTRLRRRADDLEIHGSSSTIEEALERWFTPEFRAANPEAIKRRVSNAHANDPKAYAAAYRAFVEGDLGPELHRIQSPTLIMTGEHDPGSNPRMAKFMHEQIEGSMLHIIPRLRHNILVEGADIVTARVSAFLT